MTAGKDFKRLARDRARRTGESYTSARRQLLRHASEDRMNDTPAEPASPLVAMRFDDLISDTDSGEPCVLLEEVHGDRTVMISIGTAEATAITLASMRPRRPMTHDALKQVIDAMGGTVARIIIDFPLDVGVYAADVTVILADGSSRRLDWRVSDAMALAVRLDPAPAILMPESLLTDPPSLGTLPEWISQARVTCSCGMSVSVGEQFIRVDPAPDHADVDLECWLCGERRLYRIERPPSD